MNHEPNQPAEKELTPEMQEYRRTLEKLEQDSQVDYDKAILALSGGALGISFAFFKDISARLPTTHASFLLVAWVCWAFSVTAALLSFYTSIQAMRKTIKQIDAGKHPDAEKTNAPTNFFNKLAGGLFVLGVFSAIIFLYQTLR